MGNKNLNYNYQNKQYQQETKYYLSNEVPIIDTRIVHTKVESDKLYDYIIIGSSPYSLTCAYYLTKINKSVLIIDKNETIGGSFRIDRQNGLYSEFNDTYYSDSFINFDRLLLKFGTSFKKLFRPTKYTLYDLINTEKFTVSKDKILSVLNTEILHNIYIPKEPNDNKLFKIWKENLDCDIKLGVKYEINDNVIIIDDQIYQIKNIIIDQENAKETDKYNIFYHWDSKIDLNQTKSSYNDLVLSDYMYFSDPNLVTVFSQKNISHEDLESELYSNNNPTSVTITKNYSSDNIEILVTNAIKLLYSLEPEIKKTIILEESYNVIDIVKFLLLIKFILCMFKM